MTQPQLVEITLNGSPHNCVFGDTVTALVAELTGREIDADGRAVDAKRLGVAVARNGAVVARSQWSVTALAAFDDIEIVTAVQGG